MIERSKSFFGLVFLPFSLLKIRATFKKEFKKKQAKKLPPIHTYADTYEAERVKEHLSYRLGQATIQSMKSPFGVFRLPFALRQVYREYKESRKNVS
jgi:hypothetical protein